MYKFVLEKITAELAKCSLGTESSANTMSTFAAAFLFLNLAAMTGVCLFNSQFHGTLTDWFVGKGAPREEPDALYQSNIGK